MPHDPEDAPTPTVKEDPALDSLEVRLAAARKVEEERLAREHAPMAEPHSLGWNVVSTMVGYPLGGIIVGFALDQWLDTTPWITIGLMFAAFLGALLHVARINKNRN